MLKSWYIISINGRLYVLFRYWERVVDNYDTRSIRKSVQTLCLNSIYKISTSKVVDIFLFYKKVCCDKYDTNYILKAITSFSIKSTFRRNRKLKI